MTIQQLLYVIRITETGSFNRAAESLFMAQPSLTTAVKELKRKSASSCSTGPARA